MRLGCWSCTFKHLSQAAVNCEEVHTNYLYMHKVTGHMREASEECRKFHWEFANLLRAHSIHYEETLADDVPGLYQIPFEAFEDYIRHCIRAQNVNRPYPEIPEDCYAGLDKSVDGSYDLLVGDTRPIEINLAADEKLLDTMGSGVVDLPASTAKKRRPSPHKPRTNPHQ